MFGEMDESDVHEIANEHSHRMLGHRIANERKRERDDARAEAAYWIDEYQTATHEFSEIMREQHRMERSDLVTRLAALCSCMNLVKRNAKEKEPS